jgi:methyl-accepting chemotaxis protein
MTQSSEPTRLDRIEAVVAANADAIAANARDIAELRETQRQQWAETRASIDDVVRMIGTLAENTEQYRRQAEEDRRQAAIDRVEFRATVQSILDALTQRFSGNGHSE